MNLSVGCRIVLCVIVVTVKGTFGQMKPFNSVTMIGGEAIFNCSGSLFIPNWIMSKDGSITNQVPIAGSCNVDPSLQNHYKTEKIGGPNACNLIVFNMTMDQAGVYWCSDGVPSYALLTVLDSFSTITYNNTPDVMEGENVVITCTLNYSGSVEPAPTLRPYFYWTNNTGNNVSNAYNAPSTNNSVVSQLTVTAGRGDITPYTCRVYLQLIPSVTTGYASNTPPVDSSATSQTIPVLYPVETLSIISTVPTEDKCVSEPETLTCTANANPPAQYIWTDLKNSITTTDAVLSISSGGEYQCTAFNTIRNQLYNETINEIVTRCYSPYNLTVNGTNCENNFCTCNGNASYADPISMTCMANGIPIPSVKWRSDNSFYGLDGTIGVSINGNYTCTASNTYGGKPYSEELTVVVYDCHDPLPYTLSPSTVATALEPGSKDSYRTSGTRSSKRRVRSNHSLRNTASEESLVGAFIGMLIGVIVIVLNIVAACLFFWYYKKVEVSQSGKMKRNNKLKLDRRFPWLKKMMPCVSDTKESAGSNCLWVSLFILLGIVTGIVTFPIFILLAKKYEKNNETSALNRRENGEGNGSGENGRRPTNVSLANHNQPPSTNQMNPIRQEGPYQNESSRENIELNNSLRSRKLLLPDSQPSRPPPAGRPPPPPNKPTMNLSTNRSKDYTVNDPQKQAANPEHTTYADLPFVPRNTLPTATPVQFLNVSNDTYASLNKT